MSDLQHRLSKIKLLALDSDGVLTDGGLLYAEAVTPLVRFHIQDGLGIVTARLVGLECAVISGRNNSALARRMEELGVKEIIGAKDKAKALRELAARRGLDLSEIAFMGDDLNDLPALEIAGAAFAPANAVSEVKKIAHWITAQPGGNGAVREAIETILSAQKKWDDAVKAYLAHAQNS